MRERKSRAGIVGRCTALMLITIGLPLALACSKDESRTLVNNGVDCGLFRNDLTGTWSVNFGTANVLTTNCDAGGFDGRTVDTNSTTKTFSGVIVTGSDTSAAFLVTGDGSDGAVNPELIGSVQADSCLALLRVWESDDSAFLQCIGTFDIGSRTISASCDSADIDSPVGGSIEATCDLDQLIPATFSVN